jgi:cytochrome c oxidase subunit IV
MSEPKPHPYRIYWATWFFLLIITATMLGADSINMARWVMVPFLVAFMMLKAIMIGGNFMHLRFEKRNLAFIVFAGIMVTSLILFTYIVPETANVYTRSAR